MKIVPKVLLICGIISSILYVAVDAVASSLYAGYSFTSQGFSELWVFGSPVRPFFLPLIVVRDVFLFAFTLGVWISADKNRALQVTALMFIGDNVVGLVTPIFFPPPSSLHFPLTGVEVVFILLAMAFGAAAFRSWFRFYSVGALLVLIVTGFWGSMQASHFAAGESVPWFGVIERILIYGYLLWVAVLAIVLLRAEKRRGGL